MLLLVLEDSTSTRVSCREAQSTHDTGRLDVLSTEPSNNTEDNTNDTIMYDRELNTEETCRIRWSKIPAEDAGDATAGASSNSIIFNPPLFDEICFGRLETTAELC
jgi:hypothetical protein